MGRVKDVGVDEHEFVVVDRDFPKSIGPLVSVFFTIGNDESIGLARLGESGSDSEI